ncbi:putative nuclease HARBI1 [Merluccius polli]|uniref:Nuclease HARBI1 n=1 Tax=Merluccius polli TaxID=89951 RepID=A0AA47MZZ8_MERPO|nr:putative nuclease HARBI1 [Merluccius polli]
MTPILHPATEPDERYSHAQRKTRSVVERCIGVVKSRFRCIDRSGGVLQYIPERACKIITCAFILHNICIMYRLPIPNITDDHDPECDVPGPVPAPCNSGIQVRQDLIRRRFM